MSGIMNMFVATKTAIAVAVDAFFNYTTLLLNTSSTNGAQNNAFLDSSGNGYHPTRNGNVTQGTFTPFSQTGWSIYNAAVSATDYYCQLNNSDYSLSTGDFTIEFWMFVASDKAATCFASAATNTNLTVAMNGGSAGARFPYLEYATGGTTFATAFSNYLNTWTHVAFVRSSGTVTVYQNGVAITSASKAGAVGTTANLKLLRNSGDAGQDFPGYISNFRICKAAVYTGNFTPTTTNFTTSSQGATSCQLLTFQNNRFIDNSSNAATVTPTNTAVQAFSPFAPTAAYDAAVVGGSGYFDGTGDYLNTSGANLAVGTGDFTYQFWMYALANNKSIFDTRTVNNTATGFTFLLNSSNFLSIYTNSSILTASTAVTLNAWNFVSLVRSSGTLTIYLNGVSVGSAAFSNNLTDSTIKVGNYVDDSGAYSGYISGLQILKGTAASGAILTAPPTPITDTQFLLNFTNAGIFDSAAKNDLETLGIAQVSTTQAKWGTTSMYFANGGTDYLLGSIVNDPNFTFPGDFTVELWLYPTSTPGSYNCIIGNHSETVTTYGWNLMLTSGGLVHVNLQGASVNSAGTVPLNTWTHLAIARSGPTTSIFINGVKDTALVTTSVNIYNPVYPLRIGRQVDTTPRYFYGYMDDIRITKGYARYTANFTPPIASFPTQ